MSSKITFEEAQKLVMQYVKARKWDNNSPRGIAISLSLEASELLEYFQWNEKSFGNKDDLASELADVIIYAIQFAEKFDIDISTAIKAKLEELAKKYPAEMFETDDVAERSKRWLEAKKNYRKNTTL